MKNEGFEDKVKELVALDDLKQLRREAEIADAKSKLAQAEAQVAAALFNVALLENRVALGLGDDEVDWWK